MRGGGEKIYPLPFLSHIEYLGEGGGEWLGWVKIFGGICGANFCTVCVCEDTVEKRNGFKINTHYPPWKCSFLCLSFCQCF